MLMASDNSWTDSSGLENRRGVDCTAWRRLWRRLWKRRTWGGGPWVSRSQPCGSTRTTSRAMKPTVWSSSGILRSPMATRNGCNRSSRMVSIRSSTLNFTGWHQMVPALLRSFVIIQNLRWASRTTNWVRAASWTAVSPLGAAGTTTSSTARCMTISNFPTLWAKGEDGDTPAPNPHAELSPCTPGELYVKSARAAPTRFRVWRREKGW
mmetsp:Transcript_7729/g.21932  ORF Transcript_7729/g.21932 Transcript_7729/m.21932 type:complete len:209 (+) Transcript_7729:49-675(+)